MPENVLCDLPLAAPRLKEDKGSTETIEDYHTNRRIGQEISSQSIYVLGHLINPLAPDFFFNFSTPCIQNVNNTGTKQVSIMKQTAF